MDGRMPPRRRIAYSQICTKSYCEKYLLDREITQALPMEGCHLWMFEASSLHVQNCPCRELVAFRYST